MSDSGAGGGSLSDEVAGATNVLLLAPSMESATDEACTQLLSAPANDGAYLLFVTLSDAPDDRLRTWRAQSDHSAPEEIGVIAVGDSMRSAAAEATTIGFQKPPTTIQTVSTPGDLTGLGIEMSSFLSEWGEDDRAIWVCFHSLTTLLQYVETQQAFRFLHVLTGRFATVDARAHYHIDPTAHDEQTINTLKPLFTATLAFKDGEWTARVR